MPNYGIIKNFNGGYGDYEGQVVDGLPHGEGKLSVPGGTTIQGTWYKGKVIKKSLLKYRDLPPGFVLTGE